MNRVLFVDDEQSILDGLRNSLRRQRGEWEMVFVSSGAAALEEMAKAPFDVVVTDMRMPQMDGPELLARVKARFPAAARIVLSGQADQPAIIRSLAVAHQFLSKPCDPEHLRSTIARTCGVCSILQNSAVQDAVGALDRLPSVPRTYTRLKEVIEDPKVGIGDVVAIVEQDPAMCLKILQLVNSGYFGLARPMSSIRQAVTYLGLELLKALALSAHIFSATSAANLHGLRIEDLQRHSVRMARLMRRFFSDPKESEQAFTTALLHDAGMMVLSLSVGQRYEAVTGRAASEKRPLHLVEAEMLGVTHAEVGAYLLGVWGLPYPVVEAVAFHHTPDSFPAVTDARLLAALHVADILCDGPCNNATTQAFNLPFLQSCGLEQELRRWCDLAAEEASMVTGL